MDRLLHDQADADRGREVVDDVALVDELVHDRGGEHGVDDEVEARLLPQVGDVSQRAGGEVVQAVDLPAVREQRAAQV